MSDVVLPVEILYANGVGVLSSVGDYYPLSVQKRIQVALPILPSVAFVIPLHYPLFIEKRVPIYASVLPYAPIVIPVYYDFQNSKKVKRPLPYLGELSSHTSSEFVPFDIPMVSMSKLNRKDLLIPAYSSWLEFPVDAYNIGLPPVDMGGRDCESSVSLHLGNSCDADKIESFSVNKRSSVLAKDIFIGEYIFVEKTEEDYQCTKMLHMEIVLMFLRSLTCMRRKDLIGSELCFPIENLLESILSPWTRPLFKSTISLSQMSILQRGYLLIYYPLWRV